jgi:thymidylate synthase
MADWLFHESLTFGDAASRVGLVTLWTHQRHYDAISPELYHVRGNLYAPDGVNYIARNILAHPDIRALVVCGSDGILEDTGVRDKLLAWEITDPMVPDAAQAWLRQNVRLLVCERPHLPEFLHRTNAELRAARLAERQPIVFPFKTESGAAFPSELSGMRVIWSSVFDAWIDVLRHVLRFGLEEGRRKYLLNVVSVIDDGGQSPGEERLPPEVTPEQATAYSAKFQSPERPEAVTYTYGNRILSWGEEGLNLLEMAVTKLAADPLSSQCVIDLWDNRTDVESDEPPCLTQIVLNRVAGDLYLTGLFRSHDLYRAYFLNLYALRELQSDLAHRLDCGLGKLTTVSTHAHIYTWDLESAREAVATAGRPACTWDPRGNIALTRRDGRWVAMLYGPDGRHLQDIEARGAERLLQEIVDRRALSQPSHYIYVTQQLLNKAREAASE